MNLRLLIIFILLATLIVAFSAASGENSVIKDPIAIHSIQGDGLSSPLQGMTVTIEAIVTGDFQGPEKLDGFFVQEEDSNADSKDETSEGIFVYDPGQLGKKKNISRGDLVLARGYISEFNGLTQLNLKEIKKLDKNGKKRLVTASQIVLPLESGELPESDVFLERYEGMLVVLPQELTITNLEDFSKYGELTISFDSRLPVPTNVAKPGGLAAHVQELNRRSQIILDDGSSQKYPNIDPFSKTIRSGDIVQGIEGILSYSYGNYRIEPVNSPGIKITNPRPEKPEPVGGRIKVVSLNLQNYFNGDGYGGGFPTSRGARSIEAFELQRIKIVQAIKDTRADIIGIMEIENDGYKEKSAIKDLQDALNANEKGNGRQIYSFIDPGLSKLGNDLISVGLIYDSTRLKPLGKAATRSKGAFSSGNRQPLAQTFEEIGTNERFTIVVIHLKSKNPPGNGVVADAENRDMGDGQGYWNGERTKAANELALWLSTDPTGSQDPDYLILGDVNSYRYEDPIRAFEKAGYVDLMASHPNSDSYSYGYQGSWGELDHMLASLSLAGQITGATIWHINADESSEFGYDGIWNSPDRYRCSDHDPLIAGISLI